MRLQLDSDIRGNFVLTEVDGAGNETGQSIFIQTDYDLPGIASNFGWRPCPFCQFTDGTVDCQHRTTGAMIQSARNFLDSHTGEFCENPGYTLTL